jgi:hypothetical protein
MTRVPGDTRRMCFSNESPWFLAEPLTDTVIIKDYYIVDQTVNLPRIVSSLVMIDSKQSTPQFVQQQRMLIVDK